MTRVRLIQERLDLTAELSTRSAPDDLAELEAAFVEVAKPFAEAKGITYPAWREVGVPASVLARAGITRSTPRLAGSGTGSSATGGIRWSLW